MGLGTRIPEWYLITYFSIMQKTDQYDNKWYVCVHVYVN